MKKQNAKNSETVGMTSYLTVVKYNQWLKIFKLLSIQKEARWSCSSADHKSAEISERNTTYVKYLIGNFVTVRKYVSKFITREVKRKSKSKR